MYINFCLFKETPMAPKGLKPTSILFRYELTKALH